MYACPICKSVLGEQACLQCGYQRQWQNCIPAFFTKSAVSKTYERVGKFYDELYGSMDNVWSKLAARGQESDAFISRLIMAGEPGRYLDVGCGEGYLLAEVAAVEKHGMDISAEALQAASRRAQASLCIGIAEELPFPTGYFDVISSVGVMTHFVDDVAATKEIHRALKPRGRYVVGLYIPPSYLDRTVELMQKYWYPRPRPLNFVVWLFGKAMRSVRVQSSGGAQPKERQPVERFYSPLEVEQLFGNAGFSVTGKISRRSNPEAALAGPHFRVYLLEKDG